MKKRGMLFLLLGLLILTIVGLLLLVFIGRQMGSKKIPKQVLLELDLEAGAVEYVPHDPFAQLTMEQATTVRGLAETLLQAAEDDRVKGLIARVGNNNLGTAQIQEIRDAVEAFRASGKKAVAYSETFGEFGPGNGSYYLASAFDEIYLQPSGDVNLNGLLIEAQFLRGTFEKVGVEPQMDQRYEYKNAMNTYTDKEFTPAFEEAMTALMDSIFGQMVRHIAAARGLTEDELRGLIDRGPYLGQEAVDAGLVDALAYRDEVYAQLKDELGDPELLYLKAYGERAGDLHGDGEVIALVYGVGAVVRGEASFNPLTGANSLAADPVSRALRAAVEDEDVKAIVFRVDSPGGSYVASDTVWRETIRARDAGKPVVITMGNVAASGGYFVSMDAAKIVAQPGTVTGSIGVLAGKLLTSGMWDKLGISWDSIQSSDNATMFTGTQPYTEAEWQRFQDWLDRIYEDFTGKVAAGRGMPLEEVKKVAKGRVWTGEDALEVGLVDELGGFPTALRLAREEAGLAADAPIELRVFPRPKKPLEMLFDKGAPNSEQQVAVALAQVLEQVQPAVRAAERFGLLGVEPRVLALQPEIADFRP